VIVSAPEDERRMEVLPIPEIYNQPCSQKAFYENLKHSSFINKPLHHPTFLIKPFHQSPQNRCFITHRQAYDVGVSNTLCHRMDIPNSVFETYLLFTRSGRQFKISNLKQGPDSILIFPRDADAIIYTFHALSSNVKSSGVDQGT